MTTTQTQSTDAGPSPRLHRVFILTYGGVGALLALRRPSNLFAWVLPTSGCGTAIQFAAEQYALYGAFGRVTALPGAVSSGWIAI